MDRTRDTPADIDPAEEYDLGEVEQLEPSPGARTRLEVSVTPSQLSRIDRVARELGITTIEAAERALATGLLAERARYVSQLSRRGGTYVCPTCGYEVNVGPDQDAPPCPGCGRRLDSVLSRSRERYGAVRRRLERLRRRIDRQ